MAGIQYGRAPTFSIRIVQSTEEVLIPYEQQMIVFQDIQIELDGDLLVIGEVIVT